jgi:hypothetical protein
MPKTFITERDIEDMARRGTLELALDDSIVLTDLAYEKANRLGVKLLKPNNQPPASPIRPYLSQPSAGQEIKSPTLINPGTDKPCGACMRPDTPADRNELKRRVTEAVTARLGGQVDGSLLATIVERVFADLGVA